MLDLKYIRDNAETVQKGLLTKGHEESINALLELEKERRGYLEEAEKLKHRRNVVSREIADMKKRKEDASEVIVEMQSVAKNIKELDTKISEITSKIDNILFTLPNIPSETVPDGKSEEDNVEMYKWGEKPEFDFPIKDHYTIGHDLGLFDFMRGSKISGSGFPLYTGTGAKLERSLINFMIDFHVEKHGYKEIFPPFLVNRDSAAGTGQLPKLEDDMYHCEVDDLFLIPTAEVPVTNIFKNEILKNDELPIYFTAYSACFRREAGSYGKDTRGFQRVHQFNKVEMVKFTTPESSYDELETLLKNAEEILQALEIHYRVIELCTADLSFASAKTYDIEVWSPAQEKFLEVSSCSNFEDFQARRIGIRYRKNSDGKVDFVHTLNGSGVATPRLLISILEAYQNDDGTVSVPQALQPYMNTDL
ncbi:MAG: serine--tRNA ligase, partial [bacterium]|nr:serine--tRNA ligase [bacterium]